MDKKKILGVKPYHYIYSLVIVLLVLVLVYMFVKLKQVSTDVPLQANETTTEIVPQQPVESEYEHSQTYYNISMYFLITYIIVPPVILSIFEMITAISKINFVDEDTRGKVKSTYIFPFLIISIVFSIISLIKDHLTKSQKISLMLYIGILGPKFFYELYSTFTKHSLVLVNYSRRD